MFFYVYYLQNIKIALLLYRNRERTIAKTKKDKNAKIAQLVEHDLAKVGVEGSSPFFRSRISRCSSGVERFLGKEEVMGSIPIIGSKNDI